MKYHTLILEIWPQNEFHLVLRSAANGYEQMVTLFSADTRAQAMAFAACTFQDLKWEQKPWIHNPLETLYFAQIENIFTRTQPTMTQPETAEEWIKRMGVHPSIVKDHLTNADGTLRIPHYSEWNEDFGMGYANRLAWERERGEYN